MRERRQLGAGAGHVHDRLLLVQRPFLGREVEAGEDGHAADAVRAALTGLFLQGEGRAPVRADARLDRVEDVRDPDGVSGPDDLDLNPLELQRGVEQFRTEGGELPGDDTPILQQRGRRHRSTAGPSFL